MRSQVEVEVATPVCIRRAAKREFRLEIAFLIHNWACTIISFQHLRFITIVENIYFILVGF
jgi:hypothetical protein